MTVKTEDLIEKMKKNIEKVNIKIDGKQIDLPIHYNLIATESYVENYNKTRDSKESFLIMLLDAIGLSDDKYIKNIKIENIKTINEKDLIKIGKTIVNQSKDLALNFVDDKEKSFYDNFNEAINKEYEKYKVEIKKVTDSMIEPLKKMNESIQITAKGIKSIMGNNLPVNIVDKETTLNYNYKTNNDIFKDMKLIRNPTNELLKEQIKANKSIAKILLENQKENRLANEEATKLNKKNFYIMVATLVATIIGIIITSVGVWITIKGNL